MVCECPNISLDARYNMVQAARLLEISRSTLYRYIAEGSIKFGVRKVNGMKYITGQTIIQIWKNQF